MTTLELQQSVLRDVSALLGDTDAMEYLRKILSQLKRERGMKDEDVMDKDHPYLIPGLAYTHEERMRAVRQAEEEIAAGKMEEWSEFEKEMMTW